MTRNHGKKFELVGGPSVEAGLHGLGLKPPHCRRPGSCLQKAVSAWAAYFGSTMVFDEPSGAACMPGGDSP